MAQIQEALARRFAELEAAADKLPREPGLYASDHIPSGPGRQWMASAASLIERAFGTGSVQARLFRVAHDQYSGSEFDLQHALGVLRAAKSDYEAGFFDSLERSVSGEVFGDFVGLAKHALAEGHKDVAAVLGAAALEDCLKRYAAREGIDVNDKSMQDIVNALKGKGLVSGAQKSLLDTMPKLRDYAMHADWNKLTAESVAGMLGFVEQFLLQHF